MARESNHHSLVKSASMFCEDQLEMWRGSVKIQVFQNGPRLTCLVIRWLFLENGVEKIMNHLRDGVDLKTYMSLYTAIHNFCTAQKAVGSQANLNSTHRGGKYISCPSATPTSC